MKKIFTMTLLTLLSIILIGCNNLEYSAYTEITNYDIFEYYFIGKNEVITIDYEILEQLYDYDTIEYYIEDDEVVRVNYQGNVKGKDAGKSLIKATLYDGKTAVANVAIGYFINPDLESAMMIPINTYSEFQSLLTNNTYGSLYLASNIKFPKNYDFTMIPEFRGMLVNPYGYTVSGIEGTSSIFGTLENAYIDGLIIEDSTFTGAESAALALNSEYSYVTDTHVFNSTVTGEGVSGGLISSSINSTYEFISFEGQVTSNDYAGGLFGTVNNGEEGYSYYIDNFLMNSYAYADITVTGNDLFASGLVGYVENNAKFENCYYSGTLTGDTIYQISNNLDDSLVYYINLYTSLSLSGLSSEDYAIYQLYHVSNEALLTGTVLPGLEEFTFEVGENPKN